MGSKSVTAEEFLANLPDKCEVWRGEVIATSPTKPPHGRVTATMTRILHQFVDEHQLGEVVSGEAGFRVSQDPVCLYAPDVAFVARERLGKVDPDEFYPFAPDLAVEVLSPSDKYQEMLERIKDYLDGGAQLVWLLDPKLRTVTAYQGLIQNVRVFTVPDNLEAPNLLPGFSCPVSKLFP